MATTASPKTALTALKTPLSATYPSELPSPVTLGTPTFPLMKREEGEKTPITPPAAYLDFLKALTPVVMSPLATSTSSKFSFSAQSNTSNASIPSSVSTAPSVGEEPTTKRRANTISAPSSRSSSCSASDHNSGTKSDSELQDIKIPTVPNSPFIRPMSARTPRSAAMTPRRLHIPQSPYSPGSVRSPMSAHSVRSPFSASMSPRDFECPGSATTRAVNVRQVVTRTVTYTRTPIDATPPAVLDPAPKGKRRKIE